MICANGAFVVTSSQNQRIMHLCKIIKILNNFKIFKYHRIGKFSDIIDFRKLDFLSSSQFKMQNKLIYARKLLKILGKFQIESIKSNHIV